MSILSTNSLYYADQIENFLKTENEQILGEMVQKHSLFDLNALTTNSWLAEVKILKENLCSFKNGYIALEYSIPRMGKRIDGVFIYNNYVFLLEFKVNADEYTSAAKEQVLDYALDLQNFHDKSCNLKLFPILVATRADDVVNNICIENNISNVILCNANNLKSNIEVIMNKISSDVVVEPIEWFNSPYRPTPSIIEAAQALYAGHNVEDISHKGSEEQDFQKTIECIDSIIKNCKEGNKKAICFITGVPGAGKTLVGLNIANRTHKFGEVIEKDEHAVFLSGNGPLVEVLQAALTEDRLATEKAKYEQLNVSYIEEVKKAKKENRTLGIEIKKPERPTKDGIKSQAKSFIQIVHLFRDDYFEKKDAPLERVAIFDESQRAWKEEHLTKFINEKKDIKKLQGLQGISEFKMSEPECLLDYMNRHEGWACVICLVGGGQEIHDGEAGIIEWFNALNKNENFKDWDVFYSDKMTGEEYVGNNKIADLLCNMNNKPKSYEELHLSVSMRSFRSELESAFAKAVIDNDIYMAKQTYRALTEFEPERKRIKYPILITRNLDKAKEWVKKQARGSERYGIIASSLAKRLRADGVIVPKDMDVVKWFLGNKQEVDSSYFMEIAASEFKIQGLEIDYAVLAWEGDYRYNGKEFQHFTYNGSKWNNIKSVINKRYLKNTYRVLLTRARQGMIIYVPKGNPDDITRKPEFYDGTYKYLKSIGIKEI